MSLQKRAIYMVIGAFLALGLAFGIYAASAQTGDSTESTTPSTGSDASGSPLTPWFGPGRPERGERRGFEAAGPGAGLDNEALAAALGITVDELQTAHDKARSAGLDQAVADGRLTQEQADAIRSGSLGSGRGHDFMGWAMEGVDAEALLADALGISTDELQAARDKVFSDRLAQMVTDGNLTQEQADLMQAYKSVAGNIDYTALNASVQSFYQAAVDKALAEGVITQTQADQILSDLSSRPVMGPHGFGMPFGPGRGGPGGRHGFGGRGGFFAPAPQMPDTQPSSDPNA